MLLFENYVIDLIRKFLIGRDHLIPQAHDVLPEEWLEMVAKLDRVDEAPRMRRLRFFGRVLLPAGIIATLVGVG